LNAPCPIDVELDAIATLKRLLQWLNAYLSIDVTLEAILT
jgi:hypothetical protein